VEHYNPVGTFLAENVRSPRYITAERLSPFNPRCTDVGVVLDLMIHDLGLVLQLVHSPIESIEAIGVNVLTENEDMANARIRFSDGCIANFNASRVSLKKVREIRVFQDNRYLSLDFIEQKGHLLSREPSGLTKIDVPLEKKEPLRVELESFVSCVMKMTTPRVDARLGRSALDVALRITEAVRGSRKGD
jgi:predicted dehydrogenase